MNYWPVLGAFCVVIALIVLMSLDIIPWPTEWFGATGSDSGVADSSSPGIRKTRYDGIYTTGDGGRLEIKATAATGSYQIALTKGRDYISGTATDEGDDGLTLQAGKSLVSMTFSGDSVEVKIYESGVFVYERSFSRN